MINKRAFYMLLCILFLLSAEVYSQSGTVDEARGVEVAQDIVSSEPIATCTELQPLIILVDFPDVTPRVNRSEVEDRFFLQLNKYIMTESYGKFCLGGEVTENWYEMPDPVTEYKISSRNLEVNKTRVEKLITDALNAADEDFDLSNYTYVVLVLSANVTEYGMIGLCGYPGMLGWTETEVLSAPSGERVNGGVAIFTYQAHLGTLFHDTAHILGGVVDGKRMVPCLYDHDLQALPGPAREVAIGAMKNVGFWDPMSCHFYQWGVAPPAITSWTRMRLGWLDPSKVAVVDPGEESEVLLGPLENGTSETLAIKIPLTSSTYYLIENRQPIGFDQHSPGSGVLIMFADDSIAECRHGEAPLKIIDANPAVPNLEDAAFDIGKRDEFVDEENGIKIKLLEKEDYSYRILISPL